MWSNIIQQVHSEYVWLEFAWDGLTKITVLLLVGWGTALWMNRHSASARHAVWGLTLTSTLLVPLAMLLLPGWGKIREVTPAVAMNLAAISEPSRDSMKRGEVVDSSRRRAMGGETSLTGHESASQSILDNDRNQPTATMPSDATADRDELPRGILPPDDTKTVYAEQTFLASDPSHSEGDHSVSPMINPQGKTTAGSPWGLIFTVWGIGFTLVVLPFAAGLFRVIKICRRSERLQDPNWLRLLSELARAVCLRRSVRLLRSRSPLGPSAGGVLSPFVLLPPDSDNWNRERKRLVLLHELAHIKRGDVFMQWITRIICAIYWFHPLVWLAARKMQLERERACDDLVLASGMTPANYAGELIEIAALYRTPRWMAVSAMTMARTSQLEDRVRCLLDSRRPRFRLSPRAFAVLIAGSVFLATAVATAGKVVVRNAKGEKVAEVKIPKGGTVTLEEENAVESLLDKASIQQSSHNISNPKLKLPKNDWPMWGGTSHRNNVSNAKRLPTNWNTKKNQNIRWTTELGSVIFGGTVVAGDRVFVGTNNNAEFIARYPKTVDLGCLVCLDRKTGKFLWQHSNKKLPTGRVHDWPLQGVISTPCVSGDRLWYVTNRCEVVCLDVEGFRDGKNDGPFIAEEATLASEADVVWKFDMMTNLGVSPHNVSTCSPVTDGKRLFVITGNGTDASHVNPPPKAPDVICLDRETGKILWQDRPAGERTLHGSWSSPSYGVIKGQPMVLMGCGDGWVYAYDPSGDGQGGAKLLWKFDCNPKDAIWKTGGRGNRNPYVATPVIWEDKVYLHTGQDPEHGEGNSDLWCIDPVKHLDGSDVSATLVFDGSLEGKPVGRSLSPRRLQNLDKSKGEIELPNPKSAVIWHFAEQDLNGDGKISFDERFHRGLGSPAIFEGLMFVSDFSGILFCIDANSGRCQWSYDLLAMCYGSPLIADDKVYVGDEDGDVMVFKLSKKMTLLSETANESSTYCTPVACGDTLFLLDKNKLHSIALPSKELDRGRKVSATPGDSESRERNTSKKQKAP